MYLVSFLATTTALFYFRVLNMGYLDISKLEVYSLSVPLLLSTLQMGRGGKSILPSTKLILIFLLMTGTGKAFFISCWCWVLQNVFKVTVDREKMTVKPKILENKIEPVLLYLEFWFRI